jgi:hypothetical protein
VNNPERLVDDFVEKRTVVCRDGTGRDQADDSALMFDNDGAQTVDVLPADALPQRGARRRV